MDPRMIALNRPSTGLTKYVPEKNLGTTSGEFQDGETSRHCGPRMVTDVRTQSLSLPDAVDTSSEPQLVAGCQTARN